MPRTHCKPYCENVKPYDGTYRCMRCWREFLSRDDAHILAANLKVLKEASGLEDIPQGDDAKAVVTGVSAAGAVGTMAPEAPKFSINVVRAMFGEIYAHLEDLERYIVVLGLKEKNDV